MADPGPPPFVHAGFNLHVYKDLVFSHVLNALWCVHPSLVEHDQASLYKHLSATCCSLVQGDQYNISWDDALNELSGQRTHACCWINLWRVSASGPKGQEPAASKMHAPSCIDDHYATHPQSIHFYELLGPLLETAAEVLPVGVVGAHPA